MKKNEIYKMVNHLLESRYWDLDDDSFQTINQPDRIIASGKTWKKYIDEFIRFFGFEFEKGEIPEPIGILCVYFILLIDNKYSKADDNKILSLKEIKNKSYIDLSIDEKKELIEYFFYCHYSDKQEDLPLEEEDRCSILQNDNLTDEELEKYYDNLYMFRDIYIKSENSVEDFLSKMIYGVELEKRLEFAKRKIVEELSNRLDFLTQYKEMIIKNGMKYNIESNTDKKMEPLWNYIENISIDNLSQDIDWIIDEFEQIVNRWEEKVKKI